MSRPGGSSNTPRHALRCGNRYKLQPFGPLARVRLYLTYVLSSTEILTAFIPRGVFSGGAWNILTNVGRNLSIKSWKETLTNANHSLVEVTLSQGTRSDDTFKLHSLFIISLTKCLSERCCKRRTCDFNPTIVHDSVFQGNTIKIELSNCLKILLLLLLYWTYN